jgi:hypothetical protein
VVAAAFSYLNCRQIPYQLTCPKNGYQADPTVLIDVER